MQKTPMHRTYSTAAALMAVAAVMPVTLTTANAGEGYSSGSYSGLAQKEMIRRQNAVSQSDTLRDEGREAYAKGDYKVAVDKYKAALDVLPDAPMVKDRRDYLTQLLADGSSALGEQYRKVGKYSEARQLANDVLALNPNNAEAKRLNDYLDDPIRTNPALTYEHTQNADEVRRKLYTAEGAYNLGKFDEANLTYEEVLRIDPYNKAARRGMEVVAQARADYYRAAYDQTRATLLAEVDRAWELAVPPIVNEDLITPGGGNDASLGSVSITAKLRRIIIPVIDFDNTSVEEAIDFLRVRAVEFDTSELDPAKKGINFVIRKPRADGGAAAAEGDATAGLGAAQDPGALRIDQLSLRNMPLSEVLRYICEKTRLRYKVDDYAVTLVPASETSEDLINRTFTVPPNFLSLLGEGAGGGGGGGGSDDPFADSGSGGTTLPVRRTIGELLKQNGVTDAAGSSASLTGSRLVVRNTPTNIDLIESLVDNVKDQTPKQVKISTKFVEISQENTDELGFDWIVSPFGLSANQVFAGGGTVGNGQSRRNTDFIGEIAGVTIPGIPADPSTNVSNIVTAGNRSGLGAVNRNSIDAILNNTDRSDSSATPAPGIAALTGLFSDGQVQMIMRGLAQKKGTDLMTAPSITARSGEKALIEIIREFIYPTEYEPPELPNSIGSSFDGGGGGGLGLGSASSFPVTPATPTSFETRNTGITLEIEPTIGGNDFVIDLRFAPEIVEFEGFVNYGSPIQSPATDFLGNPTTVTITENRIEMPVFSTRRVTTALTIYDGYTVAVGGLMREDVQTVEDSVPIFGDIPIVGRLFQSKAENRIKSNLIIFVTANIIDATGRPLRGVEATPRADLGGDPMMDVGTGVLPPIEQ
ncbi:type II and III secretion system protein [Luteolibacter flavescens]|uniref:Type II and III secretion system protein n=1 Tax=Luteolibacter flavescens TaxID=1859460 RepID=A0ABT3FRC2_9BACT|nr:Amuc_1098 family type IV pilus outer membrane protein [Luteolibacter flavescens]MCW1886141.1 type II and III secretion system protein [Luteolibacter flavescens]